jgi:uncharacterized protein
VAERVQMLRHCLINPGSKSVLEGGAGGPQADLDSGNQGCHCSKVKSWLAAKTIVVTGLCHNRIYEFMVQLLQLHYQQLKALNAALACDKHKCAWTKGLYNCIEEHCPLSTSWLYN